MTKAAKKQSFAALQRNKRKALQRAMNGLRDRARKVFSKGMPLDKARKVFIDYCREIESPGRKAVANVVVRDNHENRSMNVFALLPVALKVEAE